MKGIKGRLLKRFRSIPSKYTSKQNLVPFPCESSEKISALQSPQNLLNYIQQEHRTNASLDLREEEIESSLCLGSKNGHIIPHDLELMAKEIDVFEECECGFDSMPEMESSSSSSSSSSSPISRKKGAHLSFGLRETPWDDDHEQQQQQPSLNPVKTRIWEDQGECSLIKQREPTDDEGAKNLSDFDEKCPLGRNNKVILYTTSLRGTRKTYEDCQDLVKNRIWGDQGESSLTLDEQIEPTDDQGAKNMSDFEEKCPQGGNNKVILYTTSLRGIRKTYEDCQAIKFLLESFRVVYFERDVSMHLEFRDELWRILGAVSYPQSSSSKEGTLVELMRW